MLAQNKERTFPARVELFPDIMGFITAHASKAGLSSEKLYRIQLAIEEAVVNICHYAFLEEAAVNLVNYPYQSSGKFIIRVREEGSNFVVDIVDQGLAFNPLSVAPPDLNARIEEQNIKGIGIHLIRQVPDGVRYSRVEDKNVLTLIVHKGAQADG